MGCVAGSVVVGVNPEIINFYSEETVVHQMPTVKYGLVVDDFQVVEAEVKKNETFSDILSAVGVDYQTIDGIVNRSKPVFDVNKIRVGRDYTLMRDKKTNEARYLVYEPNPLCYIVYDLRDSSGVKKVDRPVEVREQVASGLVQTSLWDAIVDNNIDYNIAAKMEDALKCAVDFHHTQKGDGFKVLFTEKFVNGQSAGIDKIQAVCFRQNGEDNYAFYYRSEDGVIDGFYDDQARPMKMAFLKAPVEFARMSSGFNLKRFHPILRRVKAHLGTDYAAPQGTPILAIADGVIEEATQRGGNGIFVKMKHDKVYGSQYLHMCRIAKGVRPGVQVRQGETIGYVGSTGLATGPHVCFRFWKNGQQVDFRSEKLPRPMPMTGEHLPLFNQAKDSLMAQLKNLPENHGVETKRILQKMPQQEFVTP